MFDFLSYYNSLQYDRLFHSYFSLQYFFEAGVCGGWQEEDDKLFVILKKKMIRNICVNSI